MSTTLQVEHHVRHQVRTRGTFRLVTCVVYPAKSGEVPLYTGAVPQDEPAMTALRFPSSRRSRKIYDIAGCVVTCDESRPPSSLRQVALCPSRGFPKARQWQVVLNDVTVGPTAMHVHLWHHLGDTARYVP